MKVGRKLLIGAGMAGSALLTGILLHEKGRRDFVTPAEIAERELARWSGVTEHDPAALPILQEYWAATGQPYPGSPDVPWSGAFITNTVQKSSIPGALLPSGSHTVYSHQAYLDRGVPGRYGAYRPEEVLLEPGDIVVRGREGGALTFDEIRAGGTITPSHGDIVTAVGPSSARAVGGNMGLRHYSTVKARDIPLSAGRVADPAVVAVLRYQPGLTFP